MPVASITAPVGRIAITWSSHKGFAVHRIHLPGGDGPADTGHRSVEARRFLAVLADPERRSRDPWSWRCCVREPLTPFARRVAEALRERVPAGAAVGYGDLAALIRRPHAARAVAAVMAANRFPLVVPCHRVVAAGGRLGGFQRGVFGALARKRALLAEEGVRLDRDRVIPRRAVDDACAA